MAATSPSPARPPRGIQDFIYALEEGAGRHWLQRLFFALGSVVVMALFLLTEARNFSNPEAMDMAQLGRNLAEGRGYTTRYIRPLSLNLLAQKARAEGRSDIGLLKQPHPDLQNPPVYPVMLAGLFKIMPDWYHTSIGKGGYAARLPNEQFISLLNLGWFGLATWLVYRLGTRLFESAVGKLAALAFVGTESIWRFATNGLPTPFLLCLLLGVVSLLVSLEVLGRDETRQTWSRRLLLATFIGVLLGLGCLTTYSFGWMLIPIVGFVLVCGGTKRFLLAPLLVAVFAAVVAPWIVRNLRICNRPFGTAGYTLMALTDKFPNDRVERTQQPLPSDQLPNFEAYENKWMKGAAETLRNPLPRIGGNWLAALFLAGLMVQFQDVGRRRLHRFTLALVVWLFCVEPLCQTHLADLVPTINSENLLIFSLPLMLIFGAAFVAMLLDAIEWNHLLLRDFALGFAAFLVSLPLLTSLLPPRNDTIIEPYYAPNLIQSVARLLKPNEFIMSDIPWAVAWYGDRDCIRISLRVQDEQRKEDAAIEKTLPEDFFQINDLQRPVNALYLSPLTTEAPLKLFFDYKSDFAWGRFYFDVLLHNNAAGRFPLLQTFPGSIRAGQLFLTDYVRW